MCPTDGRRKLLVERFWYLMGAGVGSTQVLQLPGPWPWSCLVGQLSSFPFFLSLGFSSLSFLPRPAPAFFCCWHEMPPGESAGPNLQTPFIHSTSARGGPWLRTGRGGSRGGRGENLGALLSRGRQCTGRGTTCPRGWPAESARPCDGGP